MLGIEFPILAFSHCRDVVAAVSKAGGLGILGAVGHTPDMLETELNWIEDEVGDKPYGVDLLLPPKYVGAEDGGLDVPLVRRLRWAAGHHSHRVGHPARDRADTEASQLVTGLQAQGLTVGRDLGVVRLAPEVQLETGHSVSLGELGCDPRCPSSRRAASPVPGRSRPCRGPPGSGRRLDAVSSFFSRRRMVRSFAETGLDLLVTPRRLGTGVLEQPNGLRQAPITGGRKASCLGRLFPGLAGSFWLAPQRSQVGQKMPLTAARCSPGLPKMTVRRK